MPLSSITIPNSIVSIGERAFEGCYNLSSIEISSGVTSIGERAFSGCMYLNSFEIPNSVKLIGSYSFEGCGLTSLIIPKSVTEIGYAAFANCGSLESIIVESDNTTYDSRENCNAIIETSSNALIAGCKNSSIPSSVNSIGRCAFSGCYDLTSIDLPNSIESIGEEAFEGCTNLYFITIPSSVTSIGNGAFYECWNLSSIDIPNSVTSIGSTAFCYCRGLSSVNIPNSVTQIGYAAFQGCTYLTDVYCYATNVPTTDSQVFEDVPTSSATLHVPATSLEAYKITEPWSNFGTITTIAINASLTDGDTYANSNDCNTNMLTYNRTFSNTEWQALYVPFEMQYEDWQADFDVARLNNANQYDDDEDGTVDRTVLEAFYVKGGKTTANTPYLIRAKEAGEKTIVTENATLYKAEERSIDCSSVGTLFTFTGTYSGISGTEMFTNGYYAIGDGSLHQAESSANDLSPYRWYMKVTDRDGNPKDLGEVKIQVFGEDGTNGLTPTLSQGEDEGAVFDLSGRRMEMATRKGMYIRNGRKVIVR